MKKGYADVRQTSIQTMVLYFKTITKPQVKNRRGVIEHI